MKILMLFLLPFLINLQTQSDTDDFDFWIGKWHVSWEGGSGTNEISRILNDKIIQEEFEIKEGNNSGFIGKSFSAFNKNINQWQQTWIDNQGGYLDFTGGREGDKMILSRTAIDAAGKTFQQRMVWYNIKKDSFEWDWQKSTDGENWQTLWHINYQRMK